MEVGGCVIPITKESVNKSAAERNQLALCKRFGVHSDDDSVLIVAFIGGGVVTVNPRRPAGIGCRIDDGGWNLVVAVMLPIDGN